MIPSHKYLRELYPSGQPSAVLWDMDGILCDTMNLHNHAMRIVCSMHHLSFPEEITTLGVGRNDRTNMTYILSQNSTQVEKSNTIDFVSVLLTEKERILHGLLEENQLITNPGVEAWLKWLESKHIPCAIASSSSMSIIVSIVEKLGIIQYFDALVSGARMAFSKPNPEIFLRAAGALKTAPDQCLVIEDAPAGVEAAQKAGMKCLAVANSISTEKLSQADIVVSDLSTYSPDLAFG